MANEIIVLERSGTQQGFAFLYTIPVAKRIEIGGTGTTGQFPVLTPTDGLSELLLLVLTQAEKDALDAGEAVIRFATATIGQGTSSADVLAYARTKYADEAGPALAEYESRFEFVGLRFDKE